MDSRSLRLIGPIILAATALVGVLWALGFGGGAAPLLLADAGPVVRWGIPIAKLVVNLSGAGMVGSVVIALFALKPGQKSFERALDVTSISAAVFAAAAATVGIFSSASAVGAPISLDDTFGSTLGRFLGTEAGITWLITTLAGAAISVLAFAARGWFVSAVTAALAIAAMVPMATQGHSGDLANHTITLTAMVLHTVGAAVWVGGLLTLVIIRPLMRKRMVDVLYRYSTLALVSFIVVTLSGVVRAYVAVGDWSALATPYGILVLAKTALLVLLGVAGAMYRRRLIAQGGADSTGGPFWTLVAVELALMGLASGIAAALARSEPPTGLAPTPVQTPARIMTGSDLPPELTPMRWLTQWDVDILWALAIMFGAFFYIAGVVRLRRRGDSWPIYRTVLWFVGLLLLLWVTCGPVNAYGDYLFSVHMLGHMLLTMAIPLCLVAGAPVTLALRTIHKRTDGTRGGREWILWAVHSPFSRIITHPIVAAAIFVASLWVFYFTDLFRWSLYDHLGHEWMTVHFLISGYLFVLSLIGVDPIPYRFPHAGRLITLIAVAAMHAFFGMAIMMNTGLMVAEWYGSMARPWGPTPMDDQYIGGGIAWSIGEIPTLIVAITVAIQWSRSDARAQKRSDRHADRTGDQELAEYNARLARLAERDSVDQK
ncbi:MULTISPECIES: cytochrome c oxidase assembly protein [Microbacterium]|uniref:cytochrome c oxidase assembly protein n=1 Tax=Microbacterium TaxID=33882 RepID=UPI001E5AE969|nr:cytochrome c oxidase assembly protein [Microbacterium nymphoidis]MCD2498255.1 bifunctional copper resistance protein CopD/cytochrome c oxidase assembly protein [Microbacterium nymphoidis]